MGAKDERAPDLGTRCGCCQEFNKDETWLVIDIDQVLLGREYLPKCQSWQVHSLMWEGYVLGLNVSLDHSPTSPFLHIFEPKDLALNLSFYYMTLTLAHTAYESCNNYCYYYYFCYYN